VKVKLTAAQVAFAREVITPFVVCGQAVEHGDTLEFSDAEELQRFGDWVLKIGTPTVRAYVSQHVIYDKVQAALKAGRAAA